MQVPFYAAIFSPSTCDPRLDGLPAELEKYPYSYDSREASVGNITTDKENILDANQSELLSSGKSPSGRSIDVDASIHPNTTGSIKTSAGKSMIYVARTISWVEI